MKRRVLYLICYITVIGIFLCIVYGSGYLVSVVSNKVPLRRSHTIVVDAGHGGEDGGATSCTGVLESEINLEIAKKINAIFMLLGFKTKMIRIFDQSVYTEGTTIAQKKVSDLNERISIVNRTENAVLVSIHQNTFSDGQYSGGQVFYSDNQVSHQLAEHLQAQFCRTINIGSNRKCKPSKGIYLMEHIDCPGILVECGFLSNAEEEGKLRSNDYQKKISCVISSTVCNFLDRELND